jgi:hypothetical protein
MQITIGRLMAGTALGSSGLACLMYASSPWARCTLSLALGILTLAILGAILRRGERRAYWIGFALCGWTYLILVDGPWFSTSIRHRLVTTDLLKWAYPLLVPESRRPEGYAASHPVVTVYGPTLGQGVTTDNLGRRGIDVWADKGDGTKSLLAEDAEIVGRATSGDTVTRVHIRVVGPEYDRLLEAQAAQATLILEKHQPGPFSGLRSSPSVRADDLQSVGHPLFALLFGWLGSLAGRFFDTPSEQPERGDSGSASPDS